MCYSSETEVYKETRGESKAGVYLEFRVSSSGLWVTEEGDDSGSQRVLSVVVLGAVSVGELDQAVVVRQPRVCLSKTPGADEETQTRKIQ